MIMLNVGNPSAAFRWWRLPAEGVGLARMEFVINNWIKVHPVALTRFDKLEDDGARKTIEELTRGYADKGDYFRRPASPRGSRRSRRPITQSPPSVRMSDFKNQTNMPGLIGGAQFEPQEENPMLGFSGGASRYYSDRLSRRFCARMPRHPQAARGDRPSTTSVVDDPLLPLPSKRPTRCWK